MSEIVRAVACNNKSADISMTNEYIVMKGEHYRLRDWYIRKSSDNIAIPVKDVLSIEYITMRSKRMLVAFLLFSCLLLFGVQLMFRAVSVTRSIDSEIDKVEQVYNTVAEDDVNISLTDSLLEEVFNPRFIGLSLFCMVLMAGSIVSLLRYVFRPYRFFRISALGQMLAVERKHYREADLEQLRFQWLSAERLDNK